MMTLENIIRLANDPDRQAIIRGYGAICTSEHLPVNVANSVREALEDNRRSILEVAS